MNTSVSWIINPFASARHHLRAVVLIILCETWGPPVLGQTEPELEAETYAGLTIIGEIGKVYSIEYIADLTEPAENDWRCLEYLAVMGNTPSYYNGVQQETDYGTDLTRPVETVSWNDAVAYCAALTTRQRAAGWIAPNAVYRLPTEAEWEYACRAWTSTRFSYGDDSGYTNLTNYAWYYGNSDYQTHPVGQKLPNAWGLYDMHGNVFEWCQDWFDTYPGGIALDPQGPAIPSPEWVGGSLIVSPAISPSTFPNVAAACRSRSTSPRCLRRCCRSAPCRCR